MPLYAYECRDCKVQRTDMRTVVERNDGPWCDRCKRKMNLIISPVAGIVKNPAVPRRSK